MAHGDEGLGICTFFYRDVKLYDRGGADDEHATLASGAASNALKGQNIPHPRIICAIERNEESGLSDLPSYITAYADRTGAPDLVACLGNGADDYERMWLTTSLRGIVPGALRADVLHDGVHSGDTSGIAYSSFRVRRMVLSGLEDKPTSRYVPDWLQVEIPEERVV